MTESDAGRLLALHATAWPDAWRFLDEKQAAFTRKLWRRMMRDLDATACTHALARLIATSKKPPTIADLRGATMQQLHGRPRTALEAWGETKALVASKGRNRTPGQDFPIGDPVMLRTIKSIGWHHLCAMTAGPTEGADRARFCELYDELSTQAVDDQNVGEIAPPIPRRDLPSGENHIRDIVAGLLPGKEQ